MKKIRIAFCGVFDLANYGDHLFPIVFNSELNKRNIDIEIILFSPIECQQAFDDSVHVFALKDLEKNQIENPFDAIVIAGGEIIHLYNSTQITKIGATEFEEYPISETWLIPSILAYKYKIKLIWNAPGIRFEFEDVNKNVIKSMIDYVDYLSVRNDFSKKCLVNCGVDDKNIKVVPDTALAISEIVSFNELARVRAKVFSFDDKYVVFHCNKYINNNQISIVINCLNKLIEKGYRIVLLPLAYTHADDLILQHINEMANYQYHVFSNYLSILEMMSILAGSSLYIGVSFHGAITAMQYGSKVIAFDYMKNDKTKDLFENFDIEDCYITDESCLEESINYVLNNSQSIDLLKARLLIKEHFDAIFDAINSHNIEHINNDQSFAYYMAHGIVDSNIRISEMKKNLDWYRNQSVERQSYIVGLEKHIEIQEKGLEWHRKQDIERQAYIEGLEKSIESQGIGLEWHRKQDIERQVYIEGLEKNIESQGIGLEWHKKQDEDRQSYIEQLEKHIESQKQGLEWYQKQSEEEQKYISNLNKIIQEQNQGLNWYQKHDEERQTYINGLNEFIASLEKQISIGTDKQNELQATIYTMENSLSWKITKFLRRNNGGKKK